jgi:hypothetical protein
MEYGPSHQREDLKYGDPHNPRGKHTFYGPDLYAMKSSEKSKPAMESHGFYLGSAKTSGHFWQRLLATFRQG